MPIQQTEIQSPTPRFLRNRKEDIYYATRPCRLGTVLVAVTQQGICSVLLGDTARELVEDLEKRFPQANISPSESPFNQHIETVSSFLEGSSQDSLTNLPLDIRGTAFQQKVWEELRKIPSGQTISYAELAERIENPGAVRAVATACASNPLAVVVPCHRVLGSNGSLSRYRWGLERKRTLLSMERQNG